jgi:Protein of unknown function (DUF2844)
VKQGSVIVPFPTRLPAVRCLSVLILQLVLISPAFGSLGGALDSVQADQSRMMATIKTTDARAYSIHEITTPAGVVVREYVSASGRVFGVAWQGPFMPDMRLILGAYFQHFSVAAKAQRESRRNRNLLLITEPGIVVESSGHMRSYSGRAYDPGLLPEGVHGNDVR